MVSRRNFIALASGLLVPWQPERVYSFLPAWRLLNRHDFSWRRIVECSALVLLDEQCPNTSYRFSNAVIALSPSNLLDVTKSAEAFGQKLPAFLNPAEFWRTPHDWALYHEKQRSSRALGHDRMLNQDRHA